MGLDYNYFKNMQPMKYYENSLELPKAQEMINNKDQKFFAMRKYDGEWCRAIIMEDEVLLQSRSISKVTGTYGNKTLHVPQIVEELKNSFSPGTVLIGEIAFNDWKSTSREVGAIMRSLPAKAVARQKDKKLHFFVFDVLAKDGESFMDKTFSERFQPYSEFEKTKYVLLSIHKSGPNSDFMEFADWIWRKGGEGAMIVRLDSKYMPGSRRAWQSLKVKKKLGKLEVDIIETIEPNKIYEGISIDWPYVLGSEKVTKPYYFGWKNGVLINYKGREVRVTSGLTDEEREWLATEEAQTLIKENKLKAIISGMELTEDSIRHPIFIEFKK